MDETDVKIDPVLLSFELTVAAKKQRIAAQKNARKRQIRKNNKCTKEEHLSSEQVTGIQSLLDGIYYSINTNV
jgi:hypothetical protein